jgi:HTH-type transcriptional repressor of NAD biosynthesis genes
MRVAVLGAECTGKTQLTDALVQSWLQRGDAALAVPEVLRHWCTQAGRTPQAHEQAPIAHAQAAAADQAFASLTHQKTPDTPGPALLVSDTSALMTAVYSDVLFGDKSLYPWALAQQRGFDCTLLMGLDLPWVEDGIQRDGPVAQRHIDAQLRAVLDQNNFSYATVYGDGERRLANALRAIAHHQEAAAQAPTHTASNWQWQCEKCSDAACEHQLFSALLRADSVRR